MYAQLPAQHGLNDELSKRRVAEKQTGGATDGELIGNRPAPNLGLPIW